ncbi:hypothetical protein S7711_06216 [Stachybotrys chartarum IBT 7711]|uniref:Uncharacterized protein n=1 Tax=Stachybotrys chartarum (strain CBS 109288 / IBT 7711) TaxID=1280523 RepID=A0A084AWA8_STACB|nr:hypothetical protein S7711_06216 [Stachybotrys chartarum IBT 7711]KFA49258.1 hypothetical protein S40293_08332 [Stachybotrys chartarum IBT 40293]KFA71466.1 hypothetical protein S40288_08017 [Stachybotrys chartarum IBT 40288]
MTKSRRESPGPPCVINAGLFKTGTASMAEAYRILGLRPHHGLDLMNLPEHWAQLERAAETKWPSVPGARQPRAAFTQADWDVIFGEYDAITDVGAVFAEDLAGAYPEAKVVVVQRDADKWLESFERQIIVPVWGPLSYFLLIFVLPLIGNRGLSAMRKILYGQWNARTVAEVRANAKQGYATYYARIREVVPPERRLEYRLGDGWGPLCEFLGKPVPEVDFPRVNEANAHSEKQKEQADEILRMGWTVVKPWGLGLVGLCVAGITYRMVSV